MSKTPSSIVVTQQVLNLTRQILAAPGWAKTVEDIYLGGKMLTEILPALDETSWVKTDAEQRALPKAARAAYEEKDRKWATKEIPLPLTQKHVELVKKAFEHCASTGALGPSPYINELIKAFGLIKEE